MRRTYTLAFLSILSLCLPAKHAVAQRSCGVNVHMEKRYAENPRLRERSLQRQALIEEWMSNHAMAGPQSSSTIYTIPVVVHVVYKNAAENIPDSQIVSQIAVLNEDFARLNPDTGNTPIWFNVAGPTDFRFCLAQRDPDDNPTTGIERQFTTVPLFNDSTIDIYSDATGGKDAWDVERYLNIWVCAMDTGLLGYAEMPDIAPHSQSYGAVINYLYFGRGGNTLAPFNLGRTTTHEIAHCMGLRHIWGDDGGTCIADDGIPDTPLQADATLGCSTFPTFDACTPGGNGIMFMNFMDYADDSCMNMFTLGQGGWMDFEMGFDFPDLLTSDGCDPVVLTNGDVWLREIISPIGQFCDLSVSPLVQIKNYGNVAITSLDFNYAFDGGSYSVYGWTGSLAPLATAFVSIPSTALPAGVHTLTVYTSNPNGSSDPVPANDTLSSAFELLDHGASLPMTEGFEGAVFPPADWTINNPDQDYTWSLTNQAARNGINSVLLENYYYSDPTAVDELVSPLVDLRTVSNPVLTFDVAYAFFFQPGPVPTVVTDTLEILVTTDCGATYTTVYYKGGNDLQTTPDSTDQYFTPASAAEWRNELVPLSAYSSDSLVQFVFRNINQFGNNMYLDNINLTSATGIVRPESPDKITVYPNPATGQCTVDLSSLPPGVASIRMYDVLGKEVLARDEVKAGYKINMDLHGLHQGMYFVKILTGTSSKVLSLSIRN